MFWISAAPAELGAAEGCIGTDSVTDIAITTRTENQRKSILSFPRNANVVDRPWFAAQASNLVCQKINV